MTTHQPPRATVAAALAADTGRNDGAEQAAADEQADPKAAPLPRPQTIRGRWHFWIRDRAGKPVAYVVDPLPLMVQIDVSQALLSMALPSAVSALAPFLQAPNLLRLLTAKDKGSTDKARDVLRDVLQGLQDVDLSGSAAGLPPIIRSVAFSEILPLLLSTSMRDDQDMSNPGSMQQAYSGNVMEMYAAGIAIARHFGLFPSLATFGIG